jgi:hypothetical protein
MNRKILGLLAIGLVGGQIAANAQTVMTIDPNDYVTGTDISTATPGVTLDYIQVAGDLNSGPLFRPAVLGPIYSTSCPSGAVDYYTCVNPFGNNVFGHAPSNQPAFVFYSGCGSGFGATYVPNGGESNCDTAGFRADFSTATDSVSIIAPNCGSSNCDQVVLAAYDASFNEIGLCALEVNRCGTLVSPGVYDLTINTGASPIAHVVVDGAFEGLDKFSFTTTVPEIDPTSAASGLTLLLGGLLVLRGRRAKPSSVPIAL